LFSWTPKNYGPEKSILLLSQGYIYETLDRLSIEIIVRYYDNP
jgi:hypothetical protein